ncbi:protein UXT-like [Tropilaelaps mercedesae]|uniref:Protein UXT-like n=1 Tax=Tropilaelaps mercedesae TaxID=418985 RepID=A0A1V9XYH7_9ACAR|nr:protein UXT-like [Tropilaelaps mercedesae]
MALDARVVKFEHFINDVLREHLRRLEEERDKLCDQTGEYLQLRTAIERLQEDCKTNKKLRTQVDIGCNFFCQAEVPDATKVFVLLGMGIFIELTHSEALEFIDKKQALFKTRIDHMSEQCAEVKARIQMALHALRDLQGLAGELPPEPRDIWA